MTTSLTFGVLPEPGSDRLVIYVLGPGFGESEVIALPDGRWVVIDCCRAGNRCLPFDLLSWFDVQSVDLLIVTHPDLDHIDGLPELARMLDVRLLWRYPGDILVRDLLAKWLRGGDADRRFLRLHDALEIMDELADQNRSRDAAYGLSSWPFEAGAAYP